jgi:glycosyltransferase involved in cell wall biosynthesis
MRVSIFFYDFAHYHAARCRALWERLRSAGGEALIYALREQAPDRPDQGYHSLLRGKVRLLGEGSAPASSMRTVGKLLSALNHDLPDAVAIPGYSSWPCLAALAWCKVRGRLAVLLSESQRRDFQRYPWREWLKGQMVRRFDAALVGGRPHLAYVRELGLPERVIFTGYDVVDNRFWQEEADRARKRGNRRRRPAWPERYFLAVQRFIPEKNLEGLLQAYSRYRSRARAAAWHLVICGSGLLEGRVRALVGELNLAGQVHLPGYQKAEALAGWYGLAGCLIHASFREPWGLVVNEAMAAGLPVLVSQNCGCAADLVHEGVNGFTFDPGDLKGLAGLMAKMSSKEVDLQAMGQASRRIIGGWTPQTFAETLLQALEAGKAVRPGCNYFPSSPQPSPPRGGRG